VKVRIFKRGGKWQIPPMQGKDFSKTDWLYHLSAINLCIKLNNREAV